MVTKLMDVAEIRFTQVAEHVYDTFNANSERAGSVLDLMESILKGDKTPWDIPLIRVAAKKGAYWCVDNRRLFTYKHLQLGMIPVEVFNWKDNREFELKYKNGLPYRQQTSNGLRIGLLQRSGRPFPRSPVAEPTLSKFTKLFSAVQQRKHEAQIATLAKKRLEEDQTPAGGASTVATALEDLLQGGKGGEGEVPADPPAARKKRKRKKAPVPKAKAQKCTEEAAMPGEKLTVTMAKEDSDDEEFDVEITAPV
ncbi:unnamed protein product [Symbiodinium natans]|uniref:Uncharacterized protein n=1 Tax=Symbiodinium natans TaxID=878477 RepID=A0A812Q7T6_9DINO|nr:unnamed protein product [Symbiodinium natans]